MMQAGRHKITNRLQNFILSGTWLLFRESRLKNLQRTAEAYFREMKDFEDISSILNDSNSTGASWSDYYAIA